MTIGMIKSSTECVKKRNIPDNRQSLEKSLEEDGCVLAWRKESDRCAKIRRRSRSLKMTLQPSRQQTRRKQLTRQQPKQLKPSSMLSRLHRLEQARMLQRQLKMHMMH